MSKQKQMMACRVTSYGGVSRDQLTIDQWIECADEQATRLAAASQREVQWMERIDKMPIDTMTQERINVQVAKTKKSPQEVLKSAKRALGWGVAMFLSAVVLFAYNVIVY